MISRRTVALFGPTLFPVAIAGVAEASTPTEDHQPHATTMFYVYDFNWAREDFEVIGAFSKRDEAEAFAAATKPMSPYSGAKPTVIESTWRMVLDQEITSRLGKLGEALTQALGRPSA